MWHCEIAVHLYQHHTLQGSTHMQPHLLGGKTHCGCSWLQPNSCYFWKCSWRDFFWRFGKQDGLKSDWRNNPLPNNALPGAIHMKLLSDVTGIVADSHKDKTWPLFILFQNLFLLTFCCCCNCCLCLIPSPLLRSLLCRVYAVLSPTCFQYSKGVWRNLMGVWSGQVHYSAPALLEVSRYTL